MEFSSRNNFEFTSHLIDTLEYSTLHSQNKKNLILAIIHLQKLVSSGSRDCSPNVDLSIIRKLNESIVPVEFHMRSKHNNQTWVAGTPTELAHSFATPFSCVPETGPDRRDHLLI
ncbi:hypothetical protein TNCV_89121 [Trichonephila clavipes]|nr:hypothetical protein TNCV_89121 [Trichonephila clavipes]